MLHDFLYILLMLYGSIIFLIVNTRDKLKPIAVLHVLSVVVALNLYKYILMSSLNIKLTQDVGLFSQFIVLVLFFSSFGIGNFLLDQYRIKRLIVLISDGTYSLYLIHVPVGFFLFSLLINQVPNIYVLMAFVVLIVSIISFVSYRLVELPANTFCRNLIRFRT